MFTEDFSLQIKFKIIENFSAAGTNEKNFLIKRSFTSDFSSSNNLAVSVVQYKSGFQISNPRHGITCKA